MMLITGWDERVQKHNTAHQKVNNEFKIKLLIGPLNKLCEGGTGCFA